MQKDDKFGNLGLNTETKKYYQFTVNKRKLSSILQFFCTVLRDLSNLIHNNSYGDEDKEHMICDNLASIF